MNARGNARHNAGEYVRTKPEVIEKMRSELKTYKKRPGEVYSETVLNAECPEMQPRNAKQARNLAYGPSTVSGNLADDMQTIISYVGNHDFIRSVMFNDGNKPCIVLYTEQQISDIKRFCSTSSHPKIRSVLGIDRTFNLSPYYVTVTVFRNSAVVRRGTQESPIMLGPMLVHGDGEYNTYMFFLSRLKSLLNSDPSTEIRVNDDILFGSDDEKALLKAKRLTFGSAPHLFCTLHVRDNVRDYMTKIGVPASDKSEITHLLFGPSGLAASDTVEEFNLRLLDMNMKLRQTTVSDKLVTYLQSKVCPKLLNNIEVSVSGCTENVNLKLWTNNNCESTNHVLGPILVHGQQRVQYVHVFPFTTEIAYEQ